MTGVKFVTISELDNSGTAIIAEAEQGRKLVVITRRGKPVALLRKIARKDTGREEKLTDMTNNPNGFLSEVEKKGIQIIITRNNKPILLMKKISDKAFSLRE